MKLIIQIPCYNERETLAKTIADLPRHIEGIDHIEYLVIDDGSTDGTAELAHSIGVHRVIRFAQNRGLARAFAAGIDAALQLGADIIVSTDGDNQYRGEDVAKLVKPILEGKADIAIGERDIANCTHFSPIKRRLQKWGSWVMRRASGLNIPDAASGFRAWSREAAMRIVVISDFSFSMETLIHAGYLRMAVTSVPIQTNPTSRPSRLFSSIPVYLWHSSISILRTYTTCWPLRTFLSLAALLFAGGFILGIRFLYFHFTLEQAGHIQSLILAGVLLSASFIAAIAGILADLISANRRSLQEILFRVRRLESDNKRGTTESTESTETRNQKLIWAVEQARYHWSHWIILQNLRHQLLGWRSYRRSMIVLFDRQRRRRNSHFQNRPSVCAIVTVRCY
jgi:glycosyltransferase involved in cell wall biosynthesis